MPFLDASMAMPLKSSVKHPHILSRLVRRIPDFYFQTFHPGVISAIFFR
jgi:hypothetical protein